MSGPPESPPPPPPRDEAWLVEAMSHAMGRDKAREELRRAAAKLGLGAGEVAARNAARVLAEVACEPGLLGLVARRLLTKVTGEAPRAESTARPDRPVRRPSGCIPIPAELIEPSSPAAPPAPGAPAAAPVVRFTVDELIPLLERSLGRERSRTLLENALLAIGVRGPSCTHEQALNALETLANEPGIVGITARFAKPRLLLGTG